MDLRRWVLDDHALVLERLERQVIDHVPPKRWAEHVDGGGTSIGWGLFHAWYHQDLARTAVAGAPPIIAPWRARLGVGGLAPDVGVGESEVDGVAAALEPDALAGYVREVHAAMRSWLESAGPDDFDRVADGPGALGTAGVTVDAAGWLHAMWSGKPVAWFVRWEGIGHGHTHVGEMVSTRNRMGLSPF